MCVYVCVYVSEVVGLEILLKAGMPPRPLNLQAKHLVLEERRTILIRVSC